MTDQDTARKIEARKLLTQIQKLTGCDGIIALEFSHTDETLKIMTYNKVGHVPLLNEVILALCTLVATEAYAVGKAEGANLVKSNLHPSEKL